MSLGGSPLPTRYTTLPSGTAASQSNFSNSRERRRRRSAAPHRSVPRSCSRARPASGRAQTTGNDRCCRCESSARSKVSRRERSFSDLVRMQLLRHRLRIAAGDRVQERLGAFLLGTAGTRGPCQGMPRRPRAVCKSGHSRSFGAISNSGLIGDGHDHNLVVRCGPTNCESRLVTEVWSRDAVHGLLVRRALARPSPINLHILVNCLRPCFRCFQGRADNPMLPQSEFESPMFTNAPAPVAIAALTQDRALIGLLRSVVDPATDVILVTSEAGLTLPPEFASRLGGAARQHVHRGRSRRARRATARHLERPGAGGRGTAEEQSKVASQITSGVVYRFLHRPVSAPRVRLFVEAALRRHEVENDERTLEQVRPDFSRLEASRSDAPRGSSSAAPAHCHRRPGAGRGDGRRLVHVLRRPVDRCEPAARASR